MLKHVNPLLREFRYRNKVIVFNHDLVCKILGLQDGIIPLRLSGDSEDVKKLQEVYKDGDRAKIAKCKEIVQSTKDRDSFVRAFSLFALGTIYTPGIGNYISLKYLHSLVDISEISTFDWTGHVLDELMNEVKKYHKFTPDRLDKDHQMGSCLIILAIAYMDHLDLPTDRGGHQLNYNLPRICNVSNIDFDFILAVDKNRLALGNTFGKIPLEYQNVASHYSKLVEQDVLQLADATSPTISAQIKDKIIAMWRGRHIEMLGKMADLANMARNDGGEVGVSTSNVDAAAPSMCGGSDGQTSNVAATTDASTSTLEAPTSAAGSPADKRSNDSTDLTIDETIVNKPGSSTFDKKNRRKRAAIHLNQGKKLKRIKLEMKLLLHITSISARG
uniref:Aminotransferase-like plant mobile domain-containing protein n=1 Tax=Setaria viridis TaxID=4556 RepID=A0A4V6D0X6_SETVI|nr:hypothetical protein SEVIR_9G167700v2 [Setaria viridis]